MKRLLKRNEYGGIDRICHYQSGDSGISCFACINRAKCNAAIFEKLADYEESEKEPEEVQWLLKLWSAIPSKEKEYLLKRYGGSRNVDDL